MSRRRDFARMSRGLRFRLTTSYAVLFTLLLTLVALLFQRFLSTTLDKQLTEELNQEWAAMKGYLRIDRCADLNPEFVECGRELPIELGYRLWLEFQLPHVSAAGFDQ